MDRKEFKELTPIYKERLQQIAAAEEKKAIIDYFDCVRSLDEIFCFMQRFEVNRSYDRSKELDFKDLTQRIGEPVYDAISCCWLIIDEYSKADNELHFSDGTTLCDDPYIIKGRFFDKWQDLTEDQLFTRSILRRTESYESLAQYIRDSDKPVEKKVDLLKGIIRDLLQVKEDLCLRQNDRLIITNSIICIDAICTILQEVEGMIC